jgi:hypothetical protein
LIVTDVLLVVSQVRTAVFVPLSVPVKFAVGAGGVPEHA